MSGFASRFHGAGNRAAMINITSAVLSESGTYDDQYIRPFEPKLDDRSFALLKNTTEKFTKLNPNTLLQSAGMFLKPKAQPEAVSTIENGWDTRRFKYHITVEYGGAQSKIIEIISGYTTHADVSLESRHIDGNMGFYITNVARARAIEGSFGIGGLTETKISLSSNHQVLRNTARKKNASFTRSAFDNSNTMTMTPKDVFSFGQSKNVLSAMEDLEDADDDVGLVDLRTSFSAAEPIKLTKRSNTVQNNYVSTLLSSFRDAVDGIAYRTDADVFELASDNTGDVDVMSIDSLATLANKTQFVEGGFFTFDELLDLCPHLYDVLHVGFRGGNQVIPNERGQTTGFHGSGPETLVANIMAQAVSSIATDHMFAFVHFTVTNDTINGDIVFEYEHDNNYLPAYLSPAVGKNKNFASKLINAFESEIKRTAMYHATNGGNNVVTASVRFDFFGDTYLVIEVNNGGHYEYIIPSYCDGLFSPMLTTDQTAIETLSSDVETIFNYDDADSHDSSLDMSVGLFNKPAKKWSF